MEYYHGSPHLFKHFDINKIRTNGTDEGVGFYFTNRIEVARAYSQNGYLYTVKLHGQKKLSDDRVTMSRKMLKQYIEAIEEKTHFLDNFGEITFEGYSIVLNRAIENILDTCDNDNDILANIYNTCGENKEVIKIINQQFGYDHIKPKSKWGNDQKLYIALTNEIIEIINIEKR